MQGEAPPAKLQKKKKGLIPQLRWRWPPWKKDPVEDEGGTRIVEVDRHASNTSYPTNAVYTTKYNLLTFIPQNLYEQFRRVANLWFLLVCALQFIPYITPLSPWASIFPLVFVLSVTGVKEFFEDWSRRMQDRQTNNKTSSVIRGGQKKDVRWQDISVGDIVCLTSRDVVPADLLLLSASEKNGNCFLETSAIDGESNLKTRTALPQTQAFGQDFSNIDCVVECQNPNPTLYKFNATLKLNNGEAIPAGIKQFVYRGCEIRMTEWMYGVVVYTGGDTKLRKNSSVPPFKRSLLEKEVNICVLTILIFVFCLCFFCGLFAGIWATIHRSGHHVYLDMEDTPALTGFVNFWTHIILFNLMVPLSLYVTLEIVKVFNKKWIDWDLKMYDAPSDTPALARTSNLAEQLGQLDYIFSDKTGTLTANIMEFQQCSIQGKVYGSFDNFKKDTNDEAADYDETAKAAKFKDDTIGEDMNRGDAQGQAIGLFWRILAVCHTVLIEKGEGDDGATPKYSASSPDEAALVQAAQDNGFTFLGEQGGIMKINANGTEESYELLNVLEFNSDRKRMSVIVRCPDGKIRLFCKGADTAIYARLAGGQDGVINTTGEQLRDFAATGLRTLCLGYKELSEEEYAAWNEIYQAASLDLHNREQLIEDAGELIETDLTLAGATAIEDRLQDGVPQCIATLLKANLKIWVLTGDKEETAINIGFSAHLLDKDMSLMVLNNDTYPDSATLSSAFDKYIEEAQANTQSKRPNAMVIDGQSMDKIFGNPEMERKLYELGRQCKSVICCRSSPKQKALVVNMMKQNDNAQCLAIGDGANDVPMIQAAQIGVGISGKEGMQAVNSSDYAIAQFRFLERLILIHGRWSYIRVAKLILYSCYKNMTFSLILFWFTLYCGFSGQTLFTSWAIALFNSLFCFLPIFFFCLFDRDVPERKVKEYPELYETGQMSHEFTKPLFWAWIAWGIYHSIIIFFMTFWLLKDVMARDGTNSGMFLTGHTAFTTVILVVNLVLCLEFNLWTIFHMFAVAVSIFLWYMFVLIYQFVVAEEYNELYRIGTRMLNTPSHWVVVIITTYVCLYPMLAWKVIRKNYFPMNVDVVQEEAMVGKSRHDKYSKAPAMDS
eukprot:TRINITY_DN2509_c0_g1_i1.p1 TRINITY_DN2509_c0_g1~~TRINITY_DN2509_c0_g1_i1.p1  ORF type:complete len:1115 (-),score=428.74 TRINITY_DN2509_c0_g1_i1:91-3435(-)